MKTTSVVTSPGHSRYGKFETETSATTENSTFFSFVLFSFLPFVLVSCHHFFFFFQKLIRLGCSFFQSNFFCFCERFGTVYFFLTSPFYISLIGSRTSSYCFQFGTVVRTMFSGCAFQYYYFIHAFLLFMCIMTEHLTIITK